MQKAIIIGASGYTGAELARILHLHPHFQLNGLYVSAQSQDAHKAISAIYPQLKQVVDLPLQPLGEDLTSLAQENDLVFFATAHEVSHDLAPIFLQNDCKVFDLSGAFRVNCPEFYPQYYGFEHRYPELLKQAVYGLAEWNAAAIAQTDLVAVAGCYPTVSQLSLKPLIENHLLDLNQLPIINAVSGVSGAGRKASLTNSFCEVSLNAYGVFNHRHQPEIATHLGTEVIFTPHLGNFKRGILATITAKLKDGVSEQQIREAYQQYYANKPLVRVYEQGLPSIKAVEFTPYCDIGFAVKNGYIIIVGAEDNLLKGAAAQAVQCANIRYGFAESLGLI
ncbi:N-acetyl-gamma-glutamyl-phosphate reductase [Avibacterium paragallinarum]|uniref:N-acetyl-gamma-glutamyl-phosphate reductase n=1 Tax=Avibacterium paragallinarum TaxID=728 RepID=A0A0F5EW53_AVIPA|nr:N-acetyl-gamma-glutamyl-phosphate reductase [Avibacterium paragallinarum]AZI13526.1 N-acetyl-gamma-glutamyl-phosphate reductase [Avibacterium paragallinarum]KAA6208885.1 N-acetyl-gamma-glutamyl-phosphate reductase [Avibacterium paragallinarum]KKB01290.1 N-acetyl-gamma-glutamyl-phosphate reductase [Avibacterium paragallinarum]POY47635.1 N-acetyl-gamma-glutamyl-phosphate reductase [Avibacterium paragallinarum]QIR10848.1 N-acetyl-gamma-glutamyl-phosphate reductase [Avibacterium paragallinarum]